MVYRVNAFESRLVSDTLSELAVAINEELLYVVCVSRYFFLVGIKHIDLKYIPNG